MQHKSKKISYFTWGIILGCIIFIEWLKTRPSIIEKYYADGIYPLIGVSKRWLFGWLPFSLGDITVAIIIGWLLWKLFFWFRNFKKQSSPGRHIGRSLLWGLKRVLILYVLFFFLWGLNYYRLGSSYLLNIEPVSYSTLQVDSLLYHLHEKLWAIQADSLEVEQSKTNDRTLIGAEARRTYEVATIRYPFMRFRQVSLKPHLLGPLQSYSGYAGYLFPFTGEAHADFYVPPFTLPFTVCHEMAHQIGFGSESEANLVGYLACKQSKNKAFKYSAYSTMEQYALREMWLRDTVLFKKHYEQIPPLLAKDRLEYWAYKKRHVSFLQPALNSVYDFYLLRTNQPDGLDSYNYIIAWLIAYAKEYGWENL